MGLPAEPLALRYERDHPLGRSGCWAEVSRNDGGGIKIAMDGERDRRPRCGR